MTPPDLEFTDDDFDNICFETDSTDFILTELNRILAEKLDKAQTVYRLKNGLIVSPNPVPGENITFSGEVAPTHTAKLVNIEELKP